MGMMLWRDGTETRGKAEGSELRLERLTNLNILQQLDKSILIHLDCCKVRPETSETDLRRGRRVEGNVVLYF